MQNYGEPTGCYGSQATMDVYTHVNMDAKRGAAGAVLKMPWAHGRRSLGSSSTTSDTFRDLITFLPLVWVLV